MQHKPFSYQSYDDLSQDLQTIRAGLRPQEELSVLSKPITCGGITFPNRIAFQAMEGCDGETNGAPSALTRRRYERFAASGAGFLYVEATAVIDTGRANPRQLMITPDNADDFKRMVEEMRDTARKAGQPDPVIAMQLTHSGRYSKDPDRRPAPVVAWPDPQRDPKGVTPRVITDEELDALPDRFVAAAQLARQAGVDCVDIKCCHGYLLNELTGAHLRPGRYGGSFENRTRLLNVITKRVHEETGIPMMVRLNLHDEYPFPYGFGVNRVDFRLPDLTEPKTLVDRLIENGVFLIDCTAGNPYYNPHVNRPFDRGGYVPPVSQIEQLMKHWQTVREIKAHNPGAVYMASMLTWLRQFAPGMAAAAIEQGWFDLAGWGRQSFAYPSFAKDLLVGGKMDPKQCCIGCGKCTDLMRTGHGTGCVVRDKPYTDCYRSIPPELRPKTSTQIREHV